MAIDSSERELIEITAARAMADHRAYTPKIKDPALCERLAAARSAGTLTLVLGAGISYPSGAPGWEDLIAHAGARAFPADIIAAVEASRLSSVARVRFFESQIGKMVFRGHLKDALYAKVTKHAANLGAIAAFIIGEGERPRVGNVITYNFDDLLEQAIARHGSARHRAVSSAADYNTPVSDDTVRVYHPHGYLPQDGDFERVADSPIVFSENDYHRHFVDHAYWANTVQMAAFGSSHCLFIGLSFSDGNLRRLLDYSKGRGPRRHVAIQRICPDHAVPGSPYVGNFVTERDLRSLAVDTLWVRSYDDISDVLSTISSG